MAGGLTAGRSALRPAALVACALAAVAGAPGAGSAAAIAPDAPDVPYDVPVRLPEPLRSPAVAPEAPYTPTVLRLLEQLLPERAGATQIDRAVTLLTGRKSETCHGVGTNGAPPGATPALTPLCWTDAQGIDWRLAPGRTTAPMEMIGLAASFDRRYANAWGQVEGREGRQLMVTGLLGPQVDLCAVPNWRRAVNSSSGEDPFLGGELAAARIDGIQGAGLMTQVKHLGPYNGTDERRLVTVQDQAAHEILLAPFEEAVRRGRAAALMASYQPFRVDSPFLPGRVPTLEPGTPGAPPGGGPVTWPLGEAHFSSEHPWLLTYVLRGLWGSRAFVGPDYGGIHSTSAVLQGLDMEPGSGFLGTTNPGGTDPTGSTCADTGGAPAACDAPGAVHVAGIPSPACGPGGCGLAAAAQVGALPLAVVRQSLARMLYQQERFGLLGCDERAATCRNPGGVGGDRTGHAPLPAGPAGGPPVVGTRSGDAAIAEAGAERGAVLLRNEEGTLPITAADLAGGVAVTGGGAEHLVAAPFDEAATGFADRIAVGPLEQLRRLSRRREAFHYSPANDATGRPVPSSALSTSATAVTGRLARTGEGAPAGADESLDFTRASARGPLAPGSYTWSGWVRVPRADAVTFRFQASPGARVSFWLDGAERTLQAATPFYHGYYFGAMPVPVSRTVAGYTEPGLANLECPAGTPTLGWEPPGTPPERRARAPASPCPPALDEGFHAITIRLEADRPTSFRFAWSRARGDVVDAAAEARGKALALVFANDDRVPVVSSQNGEPWVSDASAAISELPPAQVQLIEAVAAANPRTVVVLNTGAPVLVPWIGRVRSVLELWNAGQEGGTATARLLLGQANPSGHTPITWPLHATDTAWGYPEPAGGLYPGSTAGPHPERLNGLPDGSSSATQGIFVGYRYYDRLGIPVRFPFGHGLSYTTFRYRALRVGRAPDGRTVVAFEVENTGKVAGAAVPQVYLGPAPDVPPHVQQAVRALRGFERVELRPGEARHVAIALPERAFQYWDSPSQAWRTAPGERELWVGEGLGDLRLHGKIEAP